jgi:predicted patatin/cPLA2 family phospholipase
LRKIDEKRLSDLYRIFKACLAVPACAVGPVRVGKRKYLDGGIANPLPVRPLLKYRGIRILGILSKPLNEGHYPTNFLERVFFWRYFRKHDWVTRCLKKSTKVYTDQVALIEEYRGLEPPAAFIIKPEKMPAADFVTRNRDKVNLTIDTGYRSVENLKDQLATFLAPELAGSRRSAANGTTVHPHNTRSRELIDTPLPRDTIKVDQTGAAAASYDELQS